MITASGWDISYHHHEVAFESEQKQDHQSRCQGPHRGSRSAVSFSSSLYWGRIIIVLWSWFTNLSILWPGEPEAHTELAASHTDHCKSCNWMERWNLWLVRKWKGRMYSKYKRANLKCCHAACASYTWRLDDQSNYATYISATYTRTKWRWHGPTAHAPPRNEGQRLSLGPYRVPVQSLQCAARSTEPGPGPGSGPEISFGIWVSVTHISTYMRPTQAVCWTSFGTRLLWFCGIAEIQSFKGGRMISR